MEKQPPAGRPVDARHAIKATSIPVKRKRQLFARLAIGLVNVETISGGHEITAG